MIMLIGIYKFFGVNYVLCGVDLYVFKGLLMVVIGGLGIGKLVLLKCIFGFVILDIGMIIVDGIDVIEYLCDLFFVWFGMLF